MSDDLTVKLKGIGDYPLDVGATLADLTGTETAELEEFVGGFENFDPRSGSVRSMIATIWLAKKQAGEKDTLHDVGQIKGLVFGDVFDIEEAVVNGRPPAQGADAPSTDETPGTEPTSDASGAGTSLSATA